MKKNILIISLILILISACSSPTQVAQETQPAVEVEPQEPSALPTDTQAPAPTQTEKPVKLTINAARSMSYAPVYLAEGYGYFAEQNLEMEYVPFNRTTEALPLLANGDIDIYGGSSGVGLINTVAIERTIAVVADKGFMGTSDCSYMGILLRQDLFDSGTITRASDLKGQTVAAGSIGGTTYYLVAKFLEQDGLTMDDIVLTDVPPAATAEAFKNKSLFAAALPDPWLASIVSTGEASLWIYGEDVIEDFQIGIIAYGPSLIKDNPEAGVRFMTAYLKGVQKYQEGKTQKNLEIISEYTDLLIEDLRASCWPPIRDDGMIQFSTIDSFQLWAIEKGLMDTPVTEEQFWNSYFVEQAYSILQQ